MDEAMEPLLTSAEAAALLRMSAATLLRYVRRQEIPFYRPAGRYLFKRAELLAWMQQRTTLRPSHHHVEANGTR